MTVVDELQQEWDAFMVPTYVDNRGRTKKTQAQNWREANPVEWQKLQDYRASKISKPSLATSTGKQMVEHVEAWLLAKGDTGGGGGGGGTTPDPTPIGNVIEFSGSVAGPTFLSKLAGAPSGRVTARPAPGQSSFSVTGDFTITRPDVTIQHMVTVGAVRFANSADRLIVEDSKMRSWYVEDGGLDGMVLQRNLFDGEALVAQNWLYGATNFKILDNTFQNYHYGPNESAHSEGIFCAAHNAGGLIKGNKFQDNGTTGHIFFSWWGASADASSPHSEYPRNICVRENTFIRSLNGYYHIQFRAEFNGTENIFIDPSNVKGESIPGYNTSLCSMADKFAKPCP